MVVKNTVYFISAPHCADCFTTNFEHDSVVAISILFCRFVNCITVSLARIYGFRTRTRTCKLVVDDRRGQGLLSRITTSVSKPMAYLLAFLTVTSCMVAGTHKLYFINKAGSWNTRNKDRQTASIYTVTIKTLTVTNK